MSNDPFIAKPPGDRYLARAAWAGSVDAVLTWLRQGYKMDAPAGGRTPLMWAISGGHKDVVTLLISKGADISQKTEEGDNALSCAVWSGETHMVQLMIEKGFSPLEKNRQGKTALDWARQGGNAGIIRLMEKCMIPISHALAMTRQQGLNALARQKKFKVGP